jgi:hypothetical protein
LPAFIGNIRDAQHVNDVGLASAEDFVIWIMRLASIPSSVIDYSAKSQIVHSSLGDEKSCCGAPRLR